MICRAQKELAGERRDTAIDNVRNLAEGVKEYG